MASGEGKKKMITLRSSDNVEFEVEAAVAMESQTIRLMIEDNCADNSIPIPNINSKLLSIVIEYCTKHVHTTKLEDAAAPAPANTAISGEDLKKWDAELVKIDHATLIDLIEVYPIVTRLIFPFLRDFEPLLDLSRGSGQVVCIRGKYTLD